MATIKFLLKPQQKKDGTFPIVIRILANGAQKMISTGMSVAKHQFKEGLENWVSKHPDAQLMNAALEHKRAELMAKILQADIDGATLDVNEVNKKPGKGKTFIDLLMEQKTTYEKRNQVAAYDKTTTRIKNIREAWNGKDVPIAQLNKYYTDLYIDHQFAKKASPNTILKDLQFFSGILKSEVTFAGENYFKKAQKLIKKEPVDREKLSLEEIKLLEQTPQFGMEDLARDMFLFCYYTQGMRIGSAAMIVRENITGQVLRYRMSKGKKMREIAIHAKLQAIIDKYMGADTPYLFPIIKTQIKDEWQQRELVDSASATINLHLKRVAVVCGINKKLSTHIAKHSFAFLSLERGVSYAILKDALGHSDFPTTQMYLNSLSDKAVDEAVRGLFD